MVTTFQRYRFVFAVGLAAVMGANDARCEGPSITSIHIVAAPAVEKEWGEAMRTYLHNTLFVPVDLSILDETESNLTMRTVGGFLGREKSHVDGLELVLLDSGASTNSDPETLVRAMGAAFDVAQWRGAYSSVPVDTWRPRLEKTIACTMGHLLGAQYCVMPLCLMHEATRLQELDDKPRNLCPPCQYRLQELLGLSASPP